MKKYILVLVSVALLVLICVLVARFGLVEENDISATESDLVTTAPSDLEDGSDFTPVLVISQDDVSWKTKKCYADGDYYNDYLAYFTVELAPDATYKLNLDLDYLTVDDEGAGGEALGFDINGVYCWEGDDKYIYSQIKRELHHTYGFYYFSTPENGESVTVNIYMLYAYEETGFEDYPPANENITFELYRVK